MIKIYTTNWCPSCISAKNLLNSLNIEFQEINIEQQNFSREQLQELTGGFTVPQIVINNTCIGGYDKLLSLHQNKKLEGLLNAK
jgi:GrxC family glutaredoxin